MFRFLENFGKSVSSHSTSENEVLSPLIMGQSFISKLVTFLTETGQISSQAGSVLHQVIPERTGTQVNNVNVILCLALHMAYLKISLETEEQ